MQSSECSLEMSHAALVCGPPLHLLSSSNNALPLSATCISLSLMYSSVMHAPQQRKIGVTLHFKKFLLTTQRISHDDVFLYSPLHSTICLAIELIYTFSTASISSLNIALVADLHM